MSSIPSTPAIKLLFLKFVLQNYEIDMHVYIYVEYLWYSFLFILLKDHYINIEMKVSNIKKQKS